MENSMTQTQLEIITFPTRASFFEYLCQFENDLQPYMKYDRFTKNVNRRTSLVRSVTELNSIYQACLKFNFRKIEFTDCGAIKKRSFYSQDAFSCEVVRNSANNILKGIIIIIIMRNRVFRFKYGALQPSDTSTTTGRKAFMTFKKIAASKGINLDSYALNDKDEAEAAKCRIESPIIANYVRYKEIKHVNHLDLHHAWPSSTCEKFPELEPVYTAISDKNIINPLNGYFQSNHCNYKFAHLAEAGVNGCNKIINDLCEKLEQQDFSILGINTDGIWYTDRMHKGRLYHDEKEGPNMHQWENDHVDCIWYARTDGQYYFIENGVFNVKARGFYQYENVKPRTEWDKNDFFKAMLTAVNFRWQDGVGLILLKEEENDE